MIDLSGLPVVVAVLALIAFAIGLLIGWLI